MDNTRQRVPLPEPMLKGTMLTSLAPMQDVTDLPFMKVMHRYGAPDYFFTEYFRVYPNSRLDRHILRSITENPSDRPVYAQLLGNSLDDIKRIVPQLENHPIAGVDLNVGCPAPKIYKNAAGGGLLRDIDRLERIVETLREAVQGSLSLKIRIGFDSFEPFEETIALVEKYSIDLLTIHARTVREAYRGEPHYEFVKKAVEALDCPVFANGNITSAAKANRVIKDTGATGVMIGRSAIRNPWIFRQVREFSHGNPIFQPTLADVRQYVDDLNEMCKEKIERERSRVNHLKKFLNFVGQSVDPDGRFMKAVRRCQDEETFFKTCDEHLIEGDKATQPFRIEPYAGVVARPNCEDGHVTEVGECKL